MIKGRSIDDEYLAAMHAMQSGVAALLTYEAGTIGNPLVGECTPKHLRVGVNSALESNGALLALLVEKGIITREEYAVKLIEYVNMDIKSYRKKIAAHLGVDISQINLG